MNLEQAILEELEENPLLEQVDQNDSQISDETLEDSPVDDIDAPLEDMYSNESNYYLSEQKQELPIADQNTFLENLINQLYDLDLNEQDRILLKKFYGTQMKEATRYRFGLIMIDTIYWKMK